MKKTVMLGEKVIEYDLTVKNVKNVNLRIKSDGSISVSANGRVRLSTIEEFIKSREDFILSALERFERERANMPKEYEYTDGERIMILGKERILRVTEGKANKAFLCDGAQYISLAVKNVSDPELRKKTFEKWQKEICRELITEVCKRTYDKYTVFKERGIPFPELHFKTMRTRWGSCNSRGGSLNFNYELIKAPLECIEYVVLHEFVHFLHNDHSKNFYGALSKLMPDWKERKKILNDRIK
jgi:predicted metal-dependent hydrolase